jgi:hypothetical protein
VTLYDDVLPALARLHGRFRLFAASNGNADLAAIGLARFFEDALAAREAGMLKPDPRIFALLLDRAGLEPAQALHVGDDASADVEGARRAGVTPVWVNRRGGEWPLAASAPPLTVRDLGAGGSAGVDRCRLATRGERRAREPGFPTPARRKRASRRVAGLDRRTAASVISGHGCTPSHRTRARAMGPLTRRRIAPTFLDDSVRLACCQQATHPAASPWSPTVERRP